MILTTHALTGAAIGKFVPNPLLQILILIPLHYAMDVFRHGEYLGKKSTFANTWWKVSIDLITGPVIIFSIFYFQNFDKMALLSMLVGAFISMFPDLLTVLYWKLNFKLLKKIYLFHQFVHKRFPDGAPERTWTLRNAVNDILFSIISILVLLLK